MATYILRHMNPDLWARVRARASQDGITLRALFLALLELYANGHVRVTVPPPVAEPIRD